MAEISVCNGVLCGDLDRLDALLPELASWYDGLAWAVWLAPWQLDRGVPVLVRGGLALDEPARVMAGWLDELDLEPRLELDLAPAGSWDELIEVVDAGFGMPDGLSFGPAFAGTAPPALRCWVARVDGRAAACAASVVHDGEVWFALVATRPEHRGRGLSTELMRPRSAPPALTAAPPRRSRPPRRAARSTRGSATRTSGRPSSGSGPRARRRPEASARGAMSRGLRAPGPWPPAGRSAAGGVLRPADIADGIVFLVSDAARMVHGVTLDVDGGISATRAA
jgi:GNAT superfamily N-acetyltransferase